MGPKKHLLLAGHGGWIREFIELLRETGKMRGIPSEIMGKRPANSAITKFSLCIDGATKKLVSGECLQFYDLNHLNSKCT